MRHCKGVFKNLGMTGQDGLMNSEESFFRLKNDISILEPVLRACSLIFKVAIASLAFLLGWKRTRLGFIGHDGIFDV